MPTFNRRRWLRECLESVLRQSVRPYEIVVVDDASSDGTAELLASYADRVRILRHERNAGVAISRNDGAMIAGGEYLAFLDDDCRAAPDWLAEFSHTVQDQPTDMVIGRLEFVAEGYRGHFPERVVTNQNAHWPVTANLLVRRAKFLQVGMFDPRFLKYRNEDSEFAIRLVASGGTYRRCPKALVVHQPDQWTTRTLLKNWRNKAVWPVLRKKYPRHYLEYNPPIRWKVVRLDELLLLLTLPVSLPALALAYFWRGERRVGVFLTRWTWLLFMQRLALWYESLRQRVFLV